MIVVFETNTYTIMKTLLHFLYSLLHSIVVIGLTSFVFILLYSNLTWWVALICAVVCWFIASTISHYMIIHHAKFLTEGSSYASAIAVFVVATLMTIVNLWIGCHEYSWQTIVYMLFCSFALFDIGKSVCMALYFGSIQK